MKIIKILLFAGIFLILISFVSADIVTPTVTNMYFEKNGVAVNENVDFSIKCYGYSYPPGPDPEKASGSYTPEEVFGFSATCPEYGCKVYENYYLNYRHIDYCSLEAEVDGESFVIEDFGDSPVLDCYMVSCREGRCYKEGEKYRSCMAAAQTTMEKDECQDLSYFDEVSYPGINENGVQQICESKFELIGTRPTPSATVEPSPSPDESPSPEPQRGFFKALGCFFSKLFGGTC